MSRTKRTDITQRLLDAMDGVALIMDDSLAIRQIGRPNWNRFLKENRCTSEALAANSINAIIGRQITAFMAGAAIRHTFAELFRGILGGRRDALRLDYRCDAPAIRRDMRLSVTPLDAEGWGRELLYQSVVLSIETRAALPLFGAQVADDEDADTLTLCAICARVAAPMGAPTGAREWIEPVEFYRRGGSDTVRISHGFCESCHAHLTDEAA